MVSGIYFAVFIFRMNQSVSFLILVLALSNWACTGVPEAKQSNVSGNSISSKSFSDNSIKEDEDSDGNLDEQNTSEEIAQSNFLYVAEFNNHMLRHFKVDSETGLLTDEHSTPVGLGPFDVVVDSENMRLFVSSIGSKLVSSYKIDPDDGSLELQGIHAESETDGLSRIPRHMSLHPSGEFLYVGYRRFDESSGESIPLKGEVVSLKVDQQSGDLTRLNSRVLLGKNPYQIQTDHDGSFLYTADFGYSSDAPFGISILRINADGQLEPAEESHNTGDRRAVCVQRHPHLDTLYFCLHAPEPGQIQKLEQNPETGLLDFPQNRETLSRPWDVKITKDGSIMLMAERSTGGVAPANVVSYQMSPSGSLLSVLDIKSQVPQGPVRIALSADERYFYTGNVDSDSVSVFSLETSGEITKLDEISLGGDNTNPWGLAITKF